MPPEKIRSDNTIVAQPPVLDLSKMRGTPQLTMSDVRNNQLQYQANAAMYNTARRAQVEKAVKNQHKQVSDQTRKVTYSNPVIQREQDRASLTPEQEMRRDQPQPKPNMAVEETIEHVVPYFFPYIGEVLMARDFLNGVKDIHDNGLNWNNGIQTALSGVPLAGGYLAGSLRVPKALSTLKNNASQISSTLNDVINWRPFVPYNPNRYYRIVGETGNPIGDAIESGVIRGPGAVPKYRETIAAQMQEASPNTIFLLPKAHDYPMFSKGKPWGGSTARLDFGKPTVIRSKADTGPIVWEESNIDFRHKGHAGIYRPSYYGELNFAPTRYFEYWEPKRFGYVRRNFPTDTNPYHNFMGRGYKINRGSWVDSDLGVDGETFGKYIGSGGEQTVFEDLSNKDNVLKVYNDTYAKSIEDLTPVVESYLQRNTIPLQQPLSFNGYIKEGLYFYPVFNQMKLQPLQTSNAEYQTKYLPLIQKALNSAGYSGDGLTTEFSNGIKTLVDIKPENMGLTSSGDIRFFDVDFINSRH